MRLTLKRHTSGPNSTLGRLYIDGDFACYTLENPWLNNERRVSCIPAGEYELGLRKEGGWHARALTKFERGFHKGMLEVLDVPNRSYILIHWGNYPSNTQGCILVGETQQADMVGWSLDAYRKIYPQIADALVCGHDVTIEITSEEEALA
jgi:hypothetical protein